MSVSVGPNDATAGLVLYLDAANNKSYPGSGTAWTDLSGNGNHVTLFNSPTYGAQGFVFNGTTQYAVTNSNLDLSGTKAITIEIFCKTVSTTAMILEHSTNANSNSAFFVLTGPDSGAPTGVVEFTDHGAAGYNVVYTNSVLNTGNWFSCCGVFDRNQSGTNQNTLYTNGLLTTVQSPTYTATITENFGSFNLYIASRAGSSTFFPGTISAIKIYNRALSATEIAQNFQAHRGRYGI
jgi:hypothetical protein